MLQSTWDFQESNLSCFSTWDFSRNAKWIDGFSTRAEKPTKNYSKLLSSFSALCPRWSITYRGNPLLCKLFNIARRHRARTPLKSFSPSSGIRNLTIWGASFLTATTLRPATLSGLMLKLPPDIFPTYNASIDLRLSGITSLMFLHLRLQPRSETNWRIFNGSWKTDQKSPQIAR